MRIITGSARGTRLETPEGLDTRPTAERVKEALFSMIQFEIDGKRVLDLFGGSGQLGLEALSRGAWKATFVDASKEAVETIKTNAKKTKLFDRCVILNTDYKAFIRGAAGKERFDIIFLDPPYAKEQIVADIEKMAERNLFSQEIMVVCETDKSVELPEEIACLGIWKEKIYGISKVTVYVR